MAVSSNSGVIISKWIKLSKISNMNRNALRLCKSCEESRLLHPAPSSAISSIKMYSEKKSESITAMPRSLVSSFNATIKQNLYKIGITLPEKYSKHQLNSAAKVLLNGIYMKVPHKTLREVAGLEDTFSMWVRMVYIHIWLLNCQLRKGGRDGEVLMYAITKLLWEDMDHRLNKFQDELKQNVEPKNKLKESYSQLVELFMLLDEGNVKGDAVLASSLWSCIYSCNTYDAEIWHLENLVHYIRLLSSRLEDFNFDFFVLRHEEIDWQFPKEILDSFEEENRKWAS